MMPQFEPDQRGEIPRPGRPQPRFGGQPMSNGSVIPVTIYGNESAPTSTMTPAARSLATTGHPHNPYGQDFYGSGERIGGSPVARNAASWMGVQPQSVVQPTPHVLNDEDDIIRHPIDPVWPKRPHAMGGQPLTW